MSRAGLLATTLLISLVDWGITEGADAALGTEFNGLLAITTATIPEGTVDTVYTAKLQVVNAVSPLRWTIVSGTLPPGLIVHYQTGVVGGDPLTPGQFRFTVQVSDSSTPRQVATRSFTINVAAMVSSPKGRPLKGCGVIAGSGQYYLTSDVTSAGTCFSIQADDVTLDLNGYTVSYGSGGGTTSHYGILGRACWDRSTPDLGDNPCGVNFAGLIVEHGKILQDVHAPPYSHAISLGQGKGAGLVVHDVEITVASPSSAAVLTSWAGGAHHIYKNTLHSNGGSGSVKNRYAEEGTVIRIGLDSGPAAPNYVHDNVITSSPQGGILTQAPYSEVYNNRVTLTSWYTNDFCFYAWGPNMEISGNTCDNSAGSGRGIDVSNSNTVVHDNQIKVRELARNAEYNGCQGGGAFGIRIAADKLPNTVTDGNEIWNNDVTAIVDQCEASGLRLTSLHPTTTNLIHDNTFLVQRIGATALIAAAITGAGDDGGAKVFHNKFVADSAGLYDHYDPMSNLVFVNNTFSPGTNPDPSGWKLVILRNGEPSTGLVFQDTVFQDGATDAASGVPIGFAGWGSAEEFFLTWTVSINVVGENKTPIAGATIQLTDSQGAMTSHMTDNRGSVSEIGREYRWYNDASVAGLKKNFSPYSVSISAPRCRPDIFDLTVTRTEQITRTLTCQQHVPTTGHQGASSDGRMNRQQ